MFLEYISTKVSKVQWIETEDQLRSGIGLKWFCGSYGPNPNQLSVWANNQLNDENIQMKSEFNVQLKSSVNQINPLDNSCISISLSNGQILCFSYSSDVFTLRHKWDSIQDYSTNDSVYNRQSNELISCGDNGVIRVLSLDNYLSENRSKCLTQNSLKSIDLISGNEVICGTSSGHLKLYDFRNQSMVQSMANELSVITCVKRNPNISHLISCGNDCGVVSLWDLRNSGQQLLQVSAHSALISQLDYKANEPNILITSSYDGSLLRWNISSSTQLESVDAIIGRDGSMSSPINSFDINSLDELVFSADNEVLYLGHL